MKLRVYIIKHLLEIKIILALLLLAQVIYKYIFRLLQGTESGIVMNNHQIFDRITAAVILLLLVYCVLMIFIFSNKKGPWNRIGYWGILIISIFSFIADLVYVYYAPIKLPGLFLLVIYALIFIICLYGIKVTKTKKISRKDSKKQVIHTSYLPKVLLILGFLIFVFLILIMSVSIRHGQVAYLTESIYENLAFILFWAAIILIPIITVFALGDKIIKSKKSAKFSFWMILFCPLIYTIVGIISLVLLIITTKYIEDCGFMCGMFELVTLILGNIISLIFGIIFSIILYRKKKKLYETK